MTPSPATDGDRDVEIRRLRAGAGILHAEPMPDATRPALWLMQPIRAALVLGSAQQADAFDVGGLSAAGIELAERRTGGGAVFIEPSQTVWIDVLAPRGDPWWCDDLAAQFVVIGACWQRAFAALGVETTLVEASPTSNAVARAACWAGVGWGELTVEGAKIVGLSQRRTRWGARIQSMAVLDGSAARVAEHLRPTSTVDPAAVRAAIGVAEVDVDRMALEAAVIEELHLLRS